MTKFLILAALIPKTSIYHPKKQHRPAKKKPLTYRNDSQWKILQFLHYTIQPKPPNLTSGHPQKQAFSKAPLKKNPENLLKLFFLPKCVIKLPPNALENLDWRNFLRPRPSEMKSQNLGEDRSTAGEKWFLASLGHFIPQKNSIIFLDFFDFG